MNESIKKAILKQKIRRSHGLIIKEEATLYSTFVEPFTDALSAVKLGAQEVLSMARLVWDTISISPKKIKEAGENFEKRKEAMSKKWEPLMERSVKALQRGDADLLALAFAPGLTLAAATTNATVAAAGGTIKFLEEAGWKAPLISGLGLPGFSVETKDDSSTSSAAPPKDEKKSLLQKLAGLFYIESSWLEGELILEAPNEDGQKSDSGSVDFKKELEDWLESTGVAEKFREDAEEFIDMYSELLSVPVGESAPKITALKEMVGSSTVEEFLAGADNAEKAGIDSEINRASLESKIQSAAEKMVATPEYEKDVKDLATSKGKNPEEQASKVSGLRLEDAKKTVFVNMKQDFDEMANAKIEELKAQALEIIENYIPDELNTSRIKTTKYGIKFLNLFKDAKLSIENA